MFSRGQPTLKGTVALKFVHFLKPNDSPATPDRVTKRDDQRVCNHPGGHLVADQQYRDATNRRFVLMISPLNKQLKSYMLTSDSENRNSSESEWHSASRLVCWRVSRVNPTLASSTSCSPFGPTSIWVPQRRGI